MTEEDLKPEPDRFHAGVLDLIRRGRLAQGTVDAILAAYPERRKAKPQTGTA